MADSLADDEARFAEIAETLLTSVDAVFDGWINRLVLQAADDSSPNVVEAAARTAREARAEVMPALRDLLQSDLADQRTGPLQVLRRAVLWPNRTLTELGITPPRRDEFAERAFPDDVYDLSPATFADIAPELAEPGLVWGAAKAHVHLRRRREPGPATVAFFAPDLMDQSRIRGALPQCEVLRNPAALAACDADIVLVDLSRPPVFDHLDGVAGAVVAFGSHVDEELLERARAAGCREVLARSVFFRRLEGCGGDARRLFGSPDADADAGAL